MASCGERLLEQKICEKILRSLHPRFDYIVCPIKESRDISSLSLEELQGSLKARKLRLKELEGKLRIKHCQLKSTRKVIKRRNEIITTKISSTKVMTNLYPHQEKEKEMLKTKGDQITFTKRRCSIIIVKSLVILPMNVDLEMENKKKKAEEEAYVAQEDDSDSDTMLLMATANEEPSQSLLWFRNIGCSNQLTSHKEWLVDIDTSRKSKIIFDYGRTLEAEGEGNIVIKRKDAKTTVIKNALYVTAMKKNIISIGQLIQKGYQVIMKNV
ncbi:uncharacterized protein [Cicer arietinum]|uniref:Uncharacterized protein LOC101510084 n=1 Tax=Cicer arietinum TaxID=3827 RepID=A0A1S2YLX5_CICAR|nr:uncharacterized protein LOC101510084 [Cicer arietinum]XP_004517205.1 uncharacterized protein LOC101515555 [Cicer arietinum]